MGGGYIPGSLLRRKCKTCWGYGLWAIGDPCPMGRMDSHSMPSKKCPECGAHGEFVVDEDEEKEGKGD